MLTLQHYTETKLHESYNEIESFFNGREEDEHDTPSHKPKDLLFDQEIIKQ